METVMIHPNGINTLKVGPDKVKRLKSLGWREEKAASAEVVEFQNKKALEFIKSKQPEPEKLVDEVGSEETEQEPEKVTKTNGRKRRGR